MKQSHCLASIPAAQKVRRFPLRPRILHAISLIVFVLVFSEAAELAAQRAKPSQYEVESAYLYNFGKFVEWPKQAADAEPPSFFICVLGQDPFGPALDSALAKQSLDGRNVTARRITKPEQVANCRILFISSSEERQLKAILHAVDKQAVLTVSDLPQFVQHGGMIGFVLQGDKVRFEVNVANAQAAGLTLSSELLKVAVLVQRSQSGD